MRLKRALVTAVGAALIASPAAMPVVALAEEGGRESVPAVQEASGYQLDIQGATINASQLKYNLMQLKAQLKDLMVKSATYNGRDITDRIEVGFGTSAADLQAQKPGTYTIHFFDGNEIATATLTVTDSTTEAAPKLDEATVSSTKGGVLLTVMGQGVTNEKHALPAGSFSVGSATKGADGAWRTTVTINSAAIDTYYKQMVPPVVWNKVAYDSSASTLTATFKWDANAQAWTVETPAKVTFNVVTDAKGDFEFADSVTLAPSDVQGLTANELIALIKEKFVQRAEVNGESVVDDYDFNVMLYNQLSDILDGKPGTYQIGFMYDNEQVGSATLVIAETEQPTGPETPGTGTTTPSTGTGEEGEPAADDATATKDASAKKASDKDDANLPDTGDVASVAGVLSAAGAALAALGTLSGRLRKRH